MENQKLKRYSLEDVANHDKSRTWIIIYNYVYDVTSFLNEHPGGEDLILAEAGKDATQPFLDAQHSTEAREMLQKYLIGEIIDSEKVSYEKSRHGPKGLKGAKACMVANLAIAGVIIGAFIAYRLYRSSSN
ncbi:cytochrome b5-like [Harmonia axyridis]|uniref:cytochrome b5-like n=1 Tax=Harmonia axyridis TaxID=115357 RepID=UPI001E27560A|nr:cytochrome b5-like [Harmonia axyridis]